MRIHLCFFRREAKLRNSVVRVESGSGASSKEKELFVETVLGFQNEWWDKTHAQAASTTETEAAADVSVNEACRHFLQHSIPAISSPNMQPRVSSHTAAK